MKFQPKKLLALLLAGLMSLSAVSCATADDPEDTKDPYATEDTVEEETGYMPEAAKKENKKNYGEDFVITGTYLLMNWLVVDDDYKAGDPLEDSFYERAIKIKDQLGVDLVLEPSNDAEYANKVLTDVKANTGDLHLVGAHCHIGVSTLMVSGGMYDFNELESVNLDAPYWSMDFMEELTIQDKFLVGFNDSCLSSAACVMFNKDLMDEYNQKAPYDDVENMTWTLDKMKATASLVSKDNGDGIWDEKDIYGISGWGWTDLISLGVGSGVKIVEKDEDDMCSVAYENNSEKTLNVLEKLSEMYDSEYGYFWSPGGKRGGVELSFSKGQTLFFTQATDGLAKLRDTTVRFGVLPVPMYDNAQGEYKCLSWNGVLMVPGAIKNPAMVSDVVELMAYYTAPVKTAYFEDLLGAKLAEAPEDAQMLDIIWNSQVTDLAMITADQNGVTNLLYMFPRLCINGINTYASYLKTNSKTATKSLNKLFNPS